MLIADIHPYDDAETLSTVESSRSKSALKTSNDENNNNNNNINIWTFAMQRIFFSCALYFHIQCWMFCCCRRQSLYLLIHISLLPTHWTGFLFSLIPSLCFVVLLAVPTQQNERLRMVDPSQPASPCQTPNSIIRNRFTQSQSIERNLLRKYDMTFLHWVVCVCTVHKLLLLSAQWNLLRLSLLAKHFMRIIMDFGIWNERVLFFLCYLFFELASIRASDMKYGSFGLSSDTHSKWEILQAAFLTHFQL